MDQTRTSGRGTSNVDQGVGKRVKEARVACGMSQAELAEALGITFQQIQKYEKGSNRIAASRLMLLARVLDKPIEWFVADMRSAEAPEAAESQSVSRERMTLLNLFSRIQNPAHRRAVISLARTLAGDDR